MKKLTFKVNSQKDCSIVSLIKEIDKISCRIYLDLENGFVTVENVNDTMIDTVIELVNNYYTILGVDIDNTFEEITDKQIIPVISESTEKTTDDSVEETVEQTTKAVTEKQPTLLEPQSKDDLIIKKVEFENNCVENHINSFLRSAYWVLYKKTATEKEISEYILTATSTISMRYSPKPIIEFSIGDIVDVNYGSQLPGEISGGHVHSIVCNIFNDTLVYLIPITKLKKDITSFSYLSFDAPKDVTYNNEYYKGGTALIDKGKYLRAERILSVIGRTKPEFFEKLLHKLASTFDFTNCLTKTIDTCVDVSEECLPEKDDSVDEVDETSVSTEDINDAVETSESKSSTDKVGRIETTLLEAIGSSFDKLDVSLSVEDQIKDFMTEIDMPTTNKLVAQSFMIACYIKKINYENIILELHKLNPNINENIIKRSLKEDFKRWLDKYPKLAEKCPKISIISLLKVFNKKLSEE